MSLFISKIIFFIKANIREFSFSKSAKKMVEAVVVEAEVVVLVVQCKF